MKKAIILITIGLSISIMLIIFSNVQLHNFEEPALETTETFFTSIEDGYYDVAKEQVDFILKERVNNFEYAEKYLNQEIQYLNDKYRLLKQGKDFAIVRANYTLVKRNDKTSMKKPVIMDVFLKLINVNENGRIKKELKIVYLESVN